MENEEKTPTYYCNAVNAKLSPYDIFLEFGKSIPLIGEDGKIEIKFERDFYLYSSPQHFKAFVEMVNGQLSLYEKEFGKINLPSKDTE